MLGHFSLSLAQDQAGAHQASATLKSDTSNEALADLDLLYIDHGIRQSAIRAVQFDNRL